MAETLSEHVEGSNFHVDKSKLIEFFQRLDNLHEDFEQKSAEFRADVKALYNEAGDVLKAPRKVVRHAYTTLRAKRKLEERESNMELAEREHLDLIRASLGDFADTPLGAAALE
jgi:hypothetical protein